MPCARCGGFMVAQHFNGGETMMEGWTYQGLRCVNCGAIVGDRDLSLKVETGHLMPALRRGAEGAS